VSIKRDDALILPHRANPAGWDFREPQVVNASELVAHLHENVPRVVRAICVGCGGPVGTEDRLRSQQTTFQFVRLLGSGAQNSIDGIDEALDLVHWASPFRAFVSHDAQRESPAKQQSNELHVSSCMQDRTPHLVIREDGDVRAILSVHSRA
jgi:hypothetical protein